MNRKVIIRAKVILKDNRLLLGALCLWFLCGFLYFALVSKAGTLAAFKATFFFSDRTGGFYAGYLMWSQAIVFGVIFTFLMHNVFEKYNPERGCRMFAKEMKDHIVVIGYSHLGERIVEFLKSSKMPYALIEKDAARVDELLRRGDPVVVDDARERDALEDAAIGAARAVILCSNNIETALVATKRARDCNPQCAIITRCYRDEFDEVLRSLGATEVISSSQSAFKDLRRFLEATGKPA